MKLYLDIFYNSIIQIYNIYIDDEMDDDIFYSSSIQIYDVYIDDEIDDDVRNLGWSL